MKKIILLLILLLTGITGLFGQSMHAVTFSLSGDGLYTINQKDDLWSAVSFACFSINYTRIFDSGFTLMVDNNFGFPMYAVIKDPGTGETEEQQISDFGFSYVDNLYFGIGFAPVNNRRNWMTITAGPNINLVSQTFIEFGFISMDVHTFGLVLDLGMGFHINRRAVFSMHLKAGYNFLGSVTYTAGEFEDTESLENYHQIFLVPSLGFGFAF